MSIAKFSHNLFLNFVLVGDATNLIAIDTQRFIDVTLFLNHIWAAPLLTLLCLINLWTILGVATLAGDIY